MDELLQRATAGDERARAELVAAHTERLHRYMARRSGARLRRDISTSDLVQEVFLRVFTALPAMPADASADTFRRWLYRHADWVMANHGKAAARHHGESAGDAAEREVVAKHSSTGAVTHADEVAWLQALLARLPSKYADVVRLRLEGMAFDDIGRRLGIAEEAARQRFARVLQALRDRLQP